MRLRPQASSLRMLRSIGTALTGALLWSAALLCAPAAASTAAGCDTADVTVVVDFGNGAIDTRCALPGGSGLDVLHRAGFTTDGTANFGPAFICRIDGVPAADPCVNTPPPTAYWRYWHSESATSDWTATTRGATSTEPRAGSFEAYAFGAGRKPEVSPAEAAAQNDTSSAEIPERPSAGGRSVDDDSPTATIVTVTAIAVLGGAAGAVALRRRGRRDSP